MKRKIDWNKINFFGGVNLDLTIAERKHLNELLHEQNKTDNIIMAYKDDFGNVYIASYGSHAWFCYHIDTVHPIAYLFEIFDFGDKLEKKKEKI